MAAKAYDAVLMVQLRRPTGDAFIDFEKEVKTRAARDYNYTYGDMQVNTLIISLYEAFMIYATVANETITEGGNLRDGKAVVGKIWNKEFKGIDGTMKIDANGERNTDFSLLDLDGTSVEYMVRQSHLLILEQKCM